MNIVLTYVGRVGISKGIGMLSMVEVQEKGLSLVCIILLRKVVHKNDVDGVKVDINSIYVLEISEERDGFTDKGVVVYFHVTEIEILSDKIFFKVVVHRYETNVEGSFVFVYDICCVFVSDL